jgi:predicted phage terminase large subunit-like protein
MEKIYVSPCKLKLDGDKVMRFTAQAAQFHAGSIYLQEDTPWVDDLVAELLGFPGMRHDARSIRSRRRSHDRERSAVAIP